MDNMRLHTQGLVKRYRARTVVNRVSVEVRQGEIVGLLGPNGAGKTTIIRIMTTLLNADSGSVVVNGFNIKSNPENIRKLFRWPLLTTYCQSGCRNGSNGQH